MLLLLQVGAAGLPHSKLNDQPNCFVIASVNFGSASRTSYSKSPDPAWMCTVYTMGQGLCKINICYRGFI